MDVSDPLSVQSSNQPSEWSNKMILLSSASDTSPLSYVYLKPGEYVISLVPTGGFSTHNASCKLKAYRGDVGNAEYVKESGLDVTLDEDNYEVVYTSGGVWMAVEEVDFDGGAITVEAVPIELE